MGTQYAFGQIVTDGLVLCLNASDRNSYVSGSTTWNDVSGRGNNGTLTNGPTFNPNNLGSIVFDGTDDYVNVANNNTLTNTSAISINMWINSTDVQTRTNDVIGKGNSDSDEEYSIIMGNTFLYFDIGNGAGPYIQPTTAFLNNTWYNICCTHNRVGGVSSLIGYVNGVALIGNVNAASNTPNDNNYPVSIGKRFYNSNPYNRNFKGSIPLVHIYNKTLSQAEITQNYNATKGRFGL
jgi:hypothetical protein